MGKVKRRLYLADALHCAIYYYFFSFLQNSKEQRETGECEKASQAPGQKSGVLGQPPHPLAKLREVRHARRRSSTLSDASVQPVCLPFSAVVPRSLLPAQVIRPPPSPLKMPLHAKKKKRNIETPQYRKIIRFVAFYRGQPKAHTCAVIKLSNPNLDEPHVRWLDSLGQEEALTQAKVLALRLKIVKKKKKLAQKQNGRICIFVQNRLE